jgi:hypothetical protein
MTVLAVSAAIVWHLVAEEESAAQAYAVSTSTDGLTLGAFRTPSHYRADNPVRANGDWVLR